MKILTMVARYLMGLLFLVFGLNGFLHFIPGSAQLPPGIPGQWLGAMAVTHYFMPVSALEVICGALFLVNRYIPLALTLICPVIVNILMFHALMMPNGVGPGVLATICWLLVYWSVRPAFKGVLEQKPSY